MFNFLEFLPGSRRLWLGLLLLAVVLPLGAWGAATYYRNRSFVNTMLGCMSVDGVGEAGFHYQEYVGEEPFRWTNGFARLLVPIGAKGPPERLWLSIEALRPKPTPVRFQVVVNEETVFDGSLPTGKWEKKFDLTSHHFLKEAIIELRSDTFKPKGVMDRGKNTDPRVLGVQVRGIMLERDEK